MDDNSFAPVPFLTREMLKFGKTSTFELAIRSVADNTNFLTLRGATRSGVISAKHTTNSDGSANTTYHRIDDIPTFFGITTLPAARPQGKLHVSVSLRINGDIVLPLTAGLMYDHKPLAWPSALLGDVMPGHGEFMVQQSSDPNAGAQISYGVPANEIWQLVHFSVTLSTDANVANRRLHVRITQNGSCVADMFTNYDHPASTAKTYSFAQYGTILAEQDGGIILGNLPSNMWLMSNTIIATVITNGQAGDDLGRLNMFREKFFSGN